MPFYKVYAGYGIADTACASILANGISPSIYPVTVRVISFSKTQDQTIFEIEAADQDIANQWGDALIHAIPQTAEYEPPVVENPDPPAGPFDVWAKVGTWSKTVGNATTTISALPGQPKGIIVWGSGLSGATVGTWSETGSVVFGFSNGTVNRDMAYVIQDNVNPTNANRSISRKAFHLVDPAGDQNTHISNINPGVTGENCTISFGATSFNMNWNATTAATEGSYFVFGGNDIELVEIRDYGVGRTTPGEVTYSGLAQQHDFAIFLTPFLILSGADAAGGTTLWYTLTGFQGALHSVSVHAGANNTKSWCSNIKSADNLTDSASNHRLQRTNKLLHTMASTASAQQQVAEWRGWTTNGFVLDWIVAPVSSSNFGFTGMFVKGGRWDTGSFLQPTAVGEVTTLVEPVTGQIKAIMGFSIGNADISTATSGTATAKWSIGAEDSSANRRCLAYSSVTAVWPSREATIMVNDKFMKHITSAATASSSTTNAECTVTDMASPGEFTVNYTTADSTGRQTVWFSLSS